MTAEQIAKLDLGIGPLDKKTEIIINSGVEWLEKNTTIDTTDIEGIPNSAKLFLMKFHDLQTLSVGVTSESIEGLSQSFDTGNKNDMLWSIAEELLGDYLIGRVRFVSAKARWR